MDSLPLTIATSKSGSWKLRRDLDVLETGVPYEFETTGTIGIATGRVTASIPKELFQDAKTTLSSLGLQMRVVHEGKAIAVVIEHDQKLGALRLLEKISSLEGLASVAAEVLVAKSKK